MTDSTWGVFVTQIIIMNIRDFDNELLRTGWHEDVSFIFPVFDNVCLKINCIEYHNNTLFLKDTYRNESIVKTCMNLSLTIESMDLDDNVEVQFVYEDSNGKDYLFQRIVTPFTKNNNNVIIEVYLE